MRKRSVWIIFLGIFLMMFCFEFGNVYSEFYNEYNSVTYEEQLKNEYYELDEQYLKKENISNVQDYIQKQKNRVIGSIIIIGLPIAFISTIGNNIFLWVILVGIYAGTRKYYKKKLSKDDFLKNKEYYREILNHYSVDLLGYIDHMSLDIENVLISMLLQLQLKGFIRINAGNIHINTAIDPNNLSVSEKYLMDRIIDNKLFINNISEYKNVVIKSCVTEGLLEEKQIVLDSLNKEGKKERFIYAIVFILYVLYWIFGPKSFSIGDNYIFVFWLVLVVFCPIFFIVGYPMYTAFKYISYYVKCTNNPYFRNKRADDINRKLEGLKNFLNDFSILDEREAKKIMLWDEYLIYSVLFGQNNKVIDEYKDLIKF